ncbi:TVP38/TMEM64 family protein [Halomonas sp. HP20-15]|uniref:TVP38/TMEM64 family protein n=1 Tax=Halomonas sp. HP20-15 TaxID=3085901 RepID=UPI002981B55A|nr:TVP38/TMEM64 family protein [Halomonas sp. HP20-15]MDW5377822.1 TVP38/TMEM64 family protein [Halomonas sp. HP20-15]
MNRSLGLVIALLLGLIGLGLLWQWLAMNDALTPQRLMETTRYALSWRDSPWAVPVVMGVYVGATLMVFPLSILVAVTGLLFGPLWGFGYALAGTLLASAVTYWVGRKLGREVLLRHGGKHLNGLAKRLAGRGIRTMTVVNLLPLAPFTLTNMMAGAFHLRFRDYMVGSLIGIIPGLVGVTLLGSQLKQLITAENRGELAWALGGITLGVLVLVALKRYADRKQRSRRAP